MKVTCGHVKACYLPPTCVKMYRATQSTSLESIFTILYSIILQGKKREKRKSILHVKTPSKLKFTMISLWSQSKMTKTMKHTC